VYRTSTTVLNVAFLSVIGAIGALSAVADAAPAMTGVSGSVAQGGTLRISGSGSERSRRQQPYLWAPINGTLNPSSPGVVKSWAGTACPGDCGSGAGPPCLALVL
jgi:hypothetical protein